MPYLDVARDFFELDGVAGARRAPRRRHHAPGVLERPVLRSLDRFARDVRRLRIAHDDVELACHGWRWGEIPRRNPDHASGGAEAPPLHRIGDKRREVAPGFGAFAGRIHGSKERAIGSVAVALELLLARKGVACGVGGVRCHGGGAKRAYGCDDLVVFGSGGAVGVLLEDVFGGVLWIPICGLIFHGGVFRRVRIVCKWRHGCPLLMFCGHFAL